MPPLILWHSLEELMVLWLVFIHKIGRQISRSVDLKFQSDNEPQPVRGEINA